MCGLAQGNMNERRGMLVRRLSMARNALNPALEIGTLGLGRGGEGRQPGHHLAWGFSLGVESSYTEGLWKKKNRFVCSTPLVWIRAV